MIFKEAVPNGYCTDILKDKMVKQNPKAAEKIDGMIEHSINTARKYLKNFRGSQKAIRLTPVYEYIERKCEKEIHTELQDLIATQITSKKSMTDSLRCVEESKWFLCHYYLKSCLRRTDNPMYRILSPPCYDEVKEKESKPYCSYVIANFSTIMYKAHNLCPALFSGNNYAELAKADITHIERCQKNSRNINKYAVKTESCYDGTGESYTGTLNVTITGKACISWASNRYLHPLTYPDLKENYCRNPQSYGDMPWCYTDMETRQWEYCNVTKCIWNRTLPGKNDEEFKMKIILGVCISLGLILITIIVSAILIKRSYLQKSKIKDDEMVPYSSKQISEVLEMREFINKTENDIPINL